MYRQGSGSGAGRKRAPGNHAERLIGVEDGDGVGSLIRGNDAASAGAKEDGLWMRGLLILGIWTTARLFTDAADTANASVRPDGEQIEDTASMR